MLFGSIGYLNLLPFHVYMKRTLRHNGAAMSFRYKRDVPSRINAALRRRHVNAAFISAAASRPFRCTDVGIVAHGRVYSVLLLPGESADDPASASSNALAKVLGLQGKVLIGDAALRYYLQGGEGIDLAEVWYERTGLPFVFARLCCNRYHTHVRTIARRFVRRRTRIPHYILCKEAAKHGITAKQLSWYLKHIHYRIDTKAERGFKRFMRASSRLVTR